MQIMQTLPNPIRVEHGVALPPTDACYRVMTVAPDGAQTIIANVWTSESRARTHIARGRRDGTQAEYSVLIEEPAPA